MNLAIGDGVKITFPMPNNSALVLLGSDSSLAIYVNGTLKTLTTDYSVSGINIVFVSAPASQALITWEGQTLDRGN